MRGIMAEYIKREAAIEAINGAYQFFEDEKDVCRRIINSVSAADVAPVVHGRWVFKRGCYEADECFCSLCKQLLTTPAKTKANYCPNCGARMDGE